MKGEDTFELKDVESQFAPYLDDIIDTNDLPVPKEGEQSLPDRSQWPNESQHILHEMSIVKNRVGFDEPAFREQCQRVQAELQQELKTIVDTLYDSLDGIVASIAKQVYQIQMSYIKEFEGQLTDIRRSTIQAGTIWRESLLIH